jgi:hypothetical protein
MKAELQKLGIDEICRITGESRSLVYSAIRCGDLDTFVVGRRRFARPRAVEKWVDFLEARSKAGNPVKYGARATK